MQIKRNIFLNPGLAAAMDTVKIAQVVTVIRWGPFWQVCRIFIQ